MLAATPKIAAILFALLAVTVPTTSFLIPHPPAQTKRRHALPMAKNPIETLVAFVKGGKTGLVKSLAGDYDSVAIRRKIDALVDTNPVLMFSFTTCPYCIKAKAILDEKGAKYTVVELDKERDGAAIRAEMGEMLGRTSVPAVWIERQFIGGCNDGPMGGVNGLNNSNRLDAMLKSAGAI
ncbi:hypothetical protein ACHAW6_012344 [Cyclotella cf. meneghiniana]